MRLIFPPSNPPFRFELWSPCLIVMMAGCAITEEPVPVTQTPAPVEPDRSPTAPSATVPSPVATTAEEMLWAKLAQAEETYVVVLRHAIAPGTGDPANFQLSDCATQRNLSETGRQQAREMGEAFRSRDIPVTQVLSSQWCRCLETAELMNVGTVEPFAPLNSFFRDRSTADAQTAKIQAYVAANQGQPGAIVMVTHQVNVTALSGIVPPSGSAVVLQQVNGQLAVLGQLSAPDS